MNIFPIELHLALENAFSCDCQMENEESLSALSPGGSYLVGEMLRYIANLISWVLNCKSPESKSTALCSRNNTLDLPHFQDYAWEDGVQ